MLVVLRGLHIHSPAVSHWEAGRGKKKGVLPPLFSGGGAYLLSHANRRVGLLDPCHGLPAGCLFRRGTPPAHAARAASG